MRRNYFAELGRLAVKRRGWFVSVTLIFLLFASFWGTKAFGSLSGGAGFEDPTSESGKADQLLLGPLGRYAADVVAIYESDRLTVVDLEFAQGVRRSKIKANEVTRLESYWSTGSADFVSSDRHSTYVTIQLPSKDDTSRVTEFKQIQDRLLADNLTVRLDSINSRMPWMALTVALISSIVLFFAFRSILLPLKSILMNLLSLSASFGAIKLIFQDGYLSNLLHFVPANAIDINMPVLILAITFGLSMDYEVFLLSRVR